MVNKKGLSDIVATVLIVLLALAAIAIIWAFIQPTINKGGCNVQTQAKCLQIELQPTSCVNASSITAENNLTVIYQLTKGDATQLSQVAIIVDDGTNSKSFRDSVPPASQYTSKSITFNNTLMGNIKASNARVAVVLNDPKCGETICPQSTATATCSKSAN